MPWLRGGRLPAAVFTLSALALVLLVLNRSTLAVLVFAVLFGGSNGMATLVRAALVGELYGQAGYGMTSSLAGVLSSTARAIARVAAAGVAAVLGGYVALLWLLAAASVVAANVSWHAVSRAHMTTIGGPTRS